MKIWLDDVRPAPVGWTWCKTAENAWVGLCVGDIKEIEEISLDHDLGPDESTGYNLVCWMERHGVWPDKVSIHSANSVGRKNIERALLANGYRRFGFGYYERG